MSEIKAPDFLHIDVGIKTLISGPLLPGELLGFQDEEAAQDLALVAKRGAIDTLLSAPV